MSQKSSGMASASKAFLSGPWLNAANLITLLRVLLAPPIVLLLLYRPHDVSYNVLAGVIFIIAALTDKVDGYYARKNDTVTRLGEFLDPLADKLLILPVMATLWYLEVLALWVLIVVLVREVMVSVIRVIGAKRGVSFPATWSGKIKMFSQIIAVSVLIIFPASSSDLVVQIIVYMMAVMTAYSGIDYLVRARREIFNRI
ncbi:MAG: CDP-diacylglycerol--glycerol-3-phosphate 3-phosphatidyltransferase [Actinobacteria bacterium]|nr:CDP-diacylglycerol--glycerol-3-phosphate 3-phosphatidyltransferase [Actinomycetota bacterium]